MEERVNHPVHHRISVTRNGDVFRHGEPANISLLRGYPAIKVGYTYRYVHHLILETFVGPKPSPKHMTRHLDGNRRNSRLSNLVWGTCKENAEDRARHGMDYDRRGKLNPNARVTPEIVAIIRSQYRYGTKRTGSESLAKKFGITSAQVRNIAMGVSWK